jgi:hypothetical protein
LFILSGVVLYYIFNIFTILDIRDFGTHDSYTINYSQGSGRLNLNFKISHDKENDFTAEVIFQTTSTGNVEDIGITSFNFDIEVNEYHKTNEYDTFIDPLTYHQNSFYIYGIHKDNLVDCIGDVDVTFNDDGVLQYETISFKLSIYMPIDPNQGFFQRDLSGIAIEVALFISLVTIIGGITKIIKKLKFQAVYPEKEKKRDNDFWNFIEKKAEEHTQE